MYVISTLRLEPEGNSRIEALRRLLEVVRLKSKQAFCIVLLNLAPFHTSLVPRWAHTANRAVSRDLPLPDAGPVCAVVLAHVVFVVEEDGSESTSCAMKGED